MSMKVTKLHTCWSAEEAEIVIDFLDTLRDELLDHYSDSIIDMRTRALAETDTSQAELDFDDDIDF